MGWWDVWCVHMTRVCLCVCLVWKLPMSWITRRNVSSELGVKSVTHTHTHILESIMAQSGYIHAYYWPFVCIYVLIFCCNPWRLAQQHIHCMHAFGTVCEYGRVLCVQTLLTYRACTHTRLLASPSVAGRPSVWPPLSCGGQGMAWVGRIWTRVGRRLMK